VRAELDPARVEQELLLFAQKTDVDEELDRLVMHLNEVRRVLDDKGQIGRRLDFLMQELTAKPTPSAQRPPTCASPTLPSTSRC